jgi:16S rRNA (adenine1518-N6/adenine1519-N6)-dimethyltransferase
MTSRDEIKSLIQEYKIKPSHFRGQNFLIDDEVYESILTTADLIKGDQVLEVGSGLGTLTSRLADTGANVTSLEIDAKLVAILRHRFASVKNIKIVEGDILKTSLASLALTGSYKVVANIPYYLTGKLLRKFLTVAPRPLSMTLLVQKEVATRMVAKAGDLSLMGINAQLYSQPALIREVSAQSFIPAPKVSSAVVHLKNVHEFPYNDIEENFFWQTAKIGFSSPRKQLTNNLKAGFATIERDEWAKIFKSVKISPKSRAEDLSLENWHGLAREIEQRRHQV